MSVSGPPVTSKFGLGRRHFCLTRSSPVPSSTWRSTHSCDFDLTTAAYDETRLARHG